MDATRTEQQLFQSCHILFGEDLHISREFLDYLQPSGLKTAYRRRAKETHPDRLHATSPLTCQAGSELFVRVHGAYERLQYFLQDRGKRCPPSANDWQKPEPAKPATPTQSTPVRPSTGTGTGTGTDGFYTGPMPNRQLLFGHFLYYSGLTNWRTISRILSWQKRDRPRLGELAKRCGLLTADDITTILSHKLPLQPFGETALRLGVLNEFQLRLLLGQQQRLQKKFGAILLEQDLITEDDLHYLLQQFSAHNAAKKLSTGR